MKKTATLLLFFAASFTLQAQSPTDKIVLAKNQQLKFITKVNSTINQEMMGQSMEILMDIATSRNITVKDITTTEYNLDAVTTHVKMNMSAMGQDKAFDSNNKNDMNGDMKDVGKDINVAKPLILSTDGKCKPAASTSPEKPAEEKDMMGDMMKQMMGGGAEEITTAAYFMLIPSGKKPGDIWTDSTVAGTTKVISNYTWDSTLANIAVIKVASKETNNSTVNTMGMDMTINMTNEIAEVRKVDFTTGVVISSNSTKKINGTIDVMGQSVPMTGTATTVTTAE